MKFAAISFLTGRQQAVHQLGKSLRVTVGVSLVMGLAACSDDMKAQKAEPAPAAVAPASAQPGPSPVPAVDAPEPVAKDLPAVDPTAEPIDPDELLKLRPD